MEKVKLPTIDLKGKSYVMVKDRLLYFNETYPNGSIQSEIKFITTNFVSFKAMVYPDIASPARVFIGRSAGPIDEEKSLEKLECVPLDTEILTRAGFKFYHELKEGEEVLTYSVKEGMSEWQRLEKISVFSPASLIKIKTSRFEAVCTFNHRWVVENKSQSLIPLDQINLENGANKLILSGAEKLSGKNGDKDVARLAWLFTDGTVRYTASGLPTSSFVKQSKVLQVEILKDLFGENVTVVKYDNGWLDSNIWWIGADEVRRILGKYNVRHDNDLISAVSKMAIEDVELFFKTAMLADGTDGSFAKTVYPVVEAMQICAARLGIKTGKIHARMCQKSTKPIYILAIHKGNGAYTSEFKIENMPPKKVWCPTTTNGTWFARQNGQVWITGNTVSVGRALAFMGIGVQESVASADEIIAYENRQIKNSKSSCTTRKVNPIQLEKGDTLATGTAKTGKKWYAIKKANKTMVWLTAEQYDYMSDNTQKRTVDSMSTKEIESFMNQPQPDDLPFS